MSHHHDKQRQRQRRPRNEQQSLPELIDIGSQYSNTGTCTQNDEETETIDWNMQPCRPRLRIVVRPASCIPPPPPQLPLPIPSAILKLAILGEPGSGKTSLVRRFVYRTTAGVSLSKNSSRQTERKEGASWAVDYYKKDVAYWNSGKTSACVRVQVWDVGGRHLTQNNNNNNAMQLLQRTDVVILVISLDQGPRHALQEARIWKRWLADMDNGEHDAKPIYWFLHKSDVIPQNKNNANMIHLGATIADTSRELGFEDWYLTSCEHEDGVSVEEAMMKVIRDNSFLEENGTPQLVPLSATSSLASSPTNNSNIIN